MSSRIQEIKSQKRKLEKVEKIIETKRNGCIKEIKISEKDENKEKSEIFIYMKNLEIVFYDVFFSKIDIIKKLISTKGYKNFDKDFENLHEDSLRHLIPTYYIKKGLKKIYEGPIRDIQMNNFMMHYSYAEGKRKEKEAKGEKEEEDLESKEEVEYLRKTYPCDMRIHTWLTDDESEEYFDGRYIKIKNFDEKIDLEYVYKVIFVLDKSVKEGAFDKFFNMFKNFEEQKKKKTQEGFEPSLETLKEE